MKKFLLILSIFIILTCGVIFFVNRNNENSKKDYIVNNYGIKITQTELNKLRSYYSMTEIENMTQEKLDKAWDGIYCVTGKDKDGNPIKSDPENCFK
jgi:hypothetical protein